MGKFTIKNDQGVELECDVLFTFDNEENNKSYIVYTDNTVDEAGNIKVYANIFDPTGENSELGAVETEKEWKLIEKLLSSLQEKIGDNNEEPTA